MNADIALACESSYGLSGEFCRLGGENENFLLVTGDGRKYVVKVADSASSTAFELERAVVDAAISAGVGLHLPTVVPASSGAPEVRCEDEKLIRVFEYVEGVAWRESDRGEPDRLRELGRALGSLGSALHGFDHPVAHRTHQWDLTRASQHSEKIRFVEDAARRRLVDSMMHVYAACTLPRLARIPKSVIHGDVNDENVLLTNARISGLIDFGDTLFNPTVCELAIALAYALLGSEDPLTEGAAIVEGYHSEWPLSISELEVLFPLVCGRLCTTVLIAAGRRRIDPDHPNWFVTEDAAWSLLETIASVDPVMAGKSLGGLTELEPFFDSHGTAAALLDDRNRHIGPSLSIAYREPIHMVRAYGQYMFDSHGRPYLDMVNNPCHVGHCHPRVVEAGQRQMEKLNTNTRYLYDGLNRYADRLCATLPDGLDTCFLVNSGSEANELALRLAMAHTGRRDVVVVESAYHGHTSRLIEISPYKFRGPGGRGEPEPWVHVAPIPDTYRGCFRGSEGEPGVAYGNELGRVIAESNAPIAAFISESLYSVGGQVIPPAGFFETAFGHVRNAGGLCIIDEVQVGFGRAGSHFWAFEIQGVVPDIVVMGKPIGNGHPMGAVVTTKEIAASFDNGMEFFATFGGNPVSCAIGLAVLDVIRDEGLQERALELGDRMLRGLVELEAKHAIIGDVRGVGLFIGVELVRNRATLEPAAEEATELINRMRHRGILLSTDGPLHNVIKIKPPMVLTADDVEMFLRVLDDELTDYAGEYDS